MGLKVKPFAPTVMGCPGSGFNQSLLIKTVAKAVGARTPEHWLLVGAQPCVQPE